MKKKIIAACFVLIALTIYGCSTQIVKLETLEEKDYYKGREIVTKEDDKIGVSVEVDSYSGEQVVFYVHFENKSGNKILVEPKDFYVEAMKKDLISVEPYFKRLYALDPEKQINKINQDMENRKTEHSVLTGLNATLALVSLVVDLTDKNEENDVNQVSRDVAVWADNQVNEEMDYDASMREHKSQKEFWKNEVMRITDLYPNDSVGGLIFVPLDKRAELLKFSIHVDNKVFTFLYKKVIVE